MSSESFLNEESELVGLLVAVDLVSIAILLVFVGRQIFRLIGERRKRLAGYQLHWQLVTLFGLITVLPSLVLCCLPILFWMSHCVAGSVTGFPRR